MTTDDEKSKAPSISWRSAPKAQPASAKFVLAVRPSSVEVDAPALQAGVDLLTVATSVHDWVTRIAGDLDKALEADKGNLELQVDACFLLRKARERLEDTKRMLGRIEENVVNQVGYTWVLRMSSEPIRGSFATGSPDVKDVPRIPSRSKDPEAYATCLKAVGVPDSCIRSGLLAFHFQGLGDYVAELAAEGKSPPKALERFGSYPVYALTLRGRSDSPLNS